MKLLLKNLLFAILVPGTFGVYLPFYIGRRSEGLNGWWNWLGAPLLLFGLVILVLCIWDFATKGEGTPFPLDPPKNLVVGQLYRYSRNPMYLGVMTALAGWAILFSSYQVVLYGLAMGVLFHLFVTLVEEPLLKKQFGETYEEYCRKVPRWF